MTKRRYTLNEAAFDAVTEESAYWVGFLMADGCITRVRSEAGEYVTLGVALKLADADREHVEKFRTFLGSSQPVYRRENYGYPAAVLQVTSKRLAAALAGYGVTPAKSHTAEVLRLESDRHFWRGVIDGDGSFRIDAHNMTGLKLVGSRRMCEQFLEFVRQHAPECKATARKHPHVYAASLCGRTATKVIQVLYGNCSVALARKLENARRILGLKARDLEPKAGMTERRRRWRDEGLCVGCGKPPAPGRVRCADCLSEKAAYQKTLNERLSAARKRAAPRALKCRACGRPCNRSVWACDACLTGHRDAKREERKARRTPSARAA